METVKPVGRQVKTYPLQTESSQAPVASMEEEIVTRWLPDWMVVRLPRWNLPAPLTLAVIAAALFGALLAPMIAAAGRLGLFFVLAILGMVAVVIVVKWRVLGFIALPFAAMMVPFAIGTGTSTGVNAAIMILGLLIGLWIMDMIARSRQIRLLPYRPVIASLVLGVIAVIAFGFGQLPWFSAPSAPITAQIGGLLIFLLSIGAFLLAAHQIRTLKELEWLTLAFLGVGFLFFALRLFPPLINIVVRIFVRQGVLGASFYIWLVAMAFSQAVLNKKLAPFWRVAAGILVFMVFFVNMRGENRYWISGWLPPMVVIITIVILRRPDLGLFAVIGGILVLAINTNIVGTIMNEGDNTYSTVTRMEAWGIIAEMVKVNPLFGLGMANYHWYTPLFPIMGYRIRFNSHNNYLDIIAQTGLIGLICFIWLVAELWFLGLNMRNRVPEGFPSAYVMGALGGLVGTVVAALLGDWVIPFVYNVGMEGLRASLFIWIFLGGLVALANLYSFSSTDAEARPG
jgi:hypothetical protein